MRGAHVSAVVLVAWFVLVLLLLVRKSWLPWTGRLLGWLLLLGLVGGLVLQPHLQGLHRTRSAVTTTPAQKEVAAKSFGRWHAVSQVMNLVAMAGLLGYFWRLTSPAHPEATPRFFSANKFKF